MEITHFQQNFVAVCTFTSRSGYVSVPPAYAMRDESRPSYCDNLIWKLCLRGRIFSLLSCLLYQNFDFSIYDCLRYNFVVFSSRLDDTYTTVLFIHKNYKQ